MNNAINEQSSCADALPVPPGVPVNSLLGGKDRRACLLRVTASHRGVRGFRCGVAVSDYLTPCLTHRKTMP